MNRHALHLCSTIALLAGLAAAAPAKAHYLWLQQDKGAGHLYFGEYEEELRERSPGRLDEMPGPELRAVVRGGTQVPVPARREADGFGFSLPAGVSTVTATEAGYAVKDWSRQHIGVVKPMFYARLVGPEVRTIAPADALPLDIVPTGKPGEFRVLFERAPLADVEVRVIAPNAWVREFKADKDGNVRVSLPWKGQYILHAIHLEKRPGTFNGAQFEAIRHRATTSVTVRTGATTTVPSTWQSSATH
jgi:hypothetical protein